jgi:SAM-dependent methyltransferase
VSEAKRFDAAWLRLRELADHSARSASLLNHLVDTWSAHGWSRVLDLGSGTGSNLRYLAPRLPTPQSWTLLDHDAALLPRAAQAPSRVTVRTRVGELAEEGLEEVARAHLVTASALLDLVSESWLTALASECQAYRCGVFFTLNYSGDIRWGEPSNQPIGASGPGDPDFGDAVIRDAMNSHQRRDKGLGPALGPQAPSAAESLLRARGYATWTAPSPWRLGPGDEPLARMLLAGWEKAALEELPDEAEFIRVWSRRKRRLIQQGRFSLYVGHVDLLALPPPSDDASQ